METFKALDPRGLYNDIVQAPLSARPADYSGKTIYLIESWGENSGFDDLKEFIQECFKRKYPGVKFLNAKRLSYSSDDPVLWKKVRSEADAFIYFAAPSCSTTAYAIAWPARALERFGVPGVVLIYKYLEEDAVMSVDREGMSIRYVDVPYPCTDLSDDDKQKIVDRVEAALTKAPEGKELIEGVHVPKAPPRIAIEGNYDEIFEYFMAQGWTDGLPIVPPTEEKVAQMLKGTSHAPEEVVCTQMAPEGRKVTVEKAAVIAVMAGAEPSYLPVILTACEIMGRTQKYHASTKSTNSFSYMQVVNGPIRNELNMNPGVYALGPGNRANAVIGRALRLALINLGGAEVGVNLMGVQGNVSAYTFCIPENEENSPWSSLACELGYGKDESVLTVFTGGWSHSGNYMLVKGMDSIMRSIKAYEYLSGYMMLLSPRRAAELCESGCDTKEKLLDYLWKAPSMTVGELKRLGHFERFIVRNIQRGTGRYPAEYLTLPDDAEIPMYPKDNVHAIVVGDPKGTNCMQSWMLWGADSVSIDKWR